MHQYVSYIIYKILYRNEERIGQPTFDDDLNSSTYKTDRLYITEIVLKVALNTMTSLLSTVNQLTHLQYNTPSKDIWINCLNVHLIMKTKYLREKLLKIKSLIYRFTYIGNERMTLFY